MTVSEQLLTLLLNSKKGEDLPVINNLQNTDKIIVFDTNTLLVSTILKSNLGITSNSGTSQKIVVTIDNDEQSIFNVDSKPDNIDLSINRINQLQNIDYTYHNLTGVLEIINPNVVNSITTESIIDLRGYQNSFSKKENLIITSIGQTIFNLSEKPNNIDLILNRGNLSENIDYTYNNITGEIEIIKQYYIDQITINGVLEARKIF